MLGTQRQREEREAGQGTTRPTGGAAGRVCRAERGCLGRAAGSPGAAADSAAP